MPDRQEAQSAGYTPNPGLVQQQQQFPTPALLGQDGTSPQMSFSFYPMGVNQNMGAMLSQVQGLGQRPGCFPMLSSFNMAPNQFAAPGAAAAGVTGMPFASGGGATTQPAVYYSMMNGGGGGALPSGAAPPPVQFTALAGAPSGCGGPMDRLGRGGDVSPTAMRKLSHNAVEVRRRRRISMQLDRLKTMLNSPKADKASLLSEAVERLVLLTKKCHSLESELAVFKATPPPPTASGAVLAVARLAEDGAAAMDEDGGGDEAHGEGQAHGEGHQTHAEDRRAGSLRPDAPAAAAAAAFFYCDGTAASSTAATASPPDASASASSSEDAPAPGSEGASPRAMPAGGAVPAAGDGGGGKGFGMLQEAAQLAAAKQAAAAEQQLQRWSQLGDASLKELLHKEAHTAWSLVVERDGISGHSAALLPPADEGLGAASEPPAPASAPTPAGPSERLDYCVKSECVIDLEPSVLADAYMRVGERHTWHSACRDARLVEDIWPDSLRVAVFTYRTELAVFPRGYCALIHRAAHTLPDGRTQIVITDRSVVHPALPASPHFILMTVYPSGMIITPVQQGGRVASHVKVVSHFHLRGTVAPALLHRLRGNRMLEACCFNYLNEFRSHVLRQHARAPHAPLAPPPPFPVDAPSLPSAKPARDATPPMTPVKGAAGEEGAPARAADVGAAGQALETSRLDTSRQDAADALIYAASC